MLKQSHDESIFDRNYKHLGDFPARINGISFDCVLPITDNGVVWQKRKKAHHEPFILNAFLKALPLSDQTMASVLCHRRIFFVGKMAK